MTSIMQRRRNLIRMSIGAIGGLMLLPMVSGRFRKRISRTGRNVFFRVSDYIQDIADMKR